LDGRVQPRLTLISLIASVVQRDLLPFASWRLCATPLLFSRAKTARTQRISVLVVARFFSSIQHPTSSSSLDSGVDAQATDRNCHQFRYAFLNSHEFSYAKHWRR